MSRNNFFAALNDDSDEEGVAVKKEQQTESQNKQKKQNNKKKPEASTSANNAAASGSSKPKKEKDPKSITKSMDEVAIIEPSKEQPRSGGAPGKRGGRNSGYVGGRDRRGKREFDRHSGQRAPRDLERKGGAGGHNWGKAGEDEERAAVDVEGEEKIDEAEGEGEVAEGEEGEEIAQEPEVKEKTLEEYEAERAAKRQGEAFKPIQAVQVEKISDGTEYKKDTAAGDELFSGMTKQRRVRDRKKEKNVVETGFTVKDNSFDDRDSGFRGRGRGGRGRGRGRGGSSGGRGRGGSRSYRANQRVDPTSSLEFPALGAA